MQLADPAVVTSARARPVLEVKDLKAYFSTEAGLVRAVNGVIFTVGEGNILDHADHPAARREMLVSAATCMRGVAARWTGTASGAISVRLTQRAPAI